MPKRKRKPKPPPLLPPDHATTMALLVKRNQQFSALFKRIKDPITLMQFYEGMTAIYNKHLLKTTGGWLTIKALLYLYDYHIVWRHEFAKAIDVDAKTAARIYTSLRYRGLVHGERTLAKEAINLAASGHLLITGFQKDIAALMLQIMGNGRKGKARHKKSRTKAGF